MQAIWRFPIFLLTVFILVILPATVSAQTYQFVTLPGKSGNKTLTVTDADGTKVTFNLNNGGLGEVVVNGTIWDVRLTATTSSSALTISTNNGGDGRVTIHDIQCTGPLAAINAATTDLTGTLSLNQPITQLTLGDLFGGAITVNGSVSTLTVRDVKPGSIWVNGPVTTLSIGQIHGVVAVNGAVDTLTTGKIIGGTLTINGAINSLTTAAIQNGTLAVQSVSTLITGDLTNANILVGTYLGKDGALGGTALDADAFGPGRIGKFRVNGSVTGSTIRVGVDPVDGIFGNGNDVIAGGAASSIVLSDLANGSFTFSVSRLNQINGGPLTDGAKTLRLLATDTKGNSTQIAFTFTLDTVISALTFDLDGTSDTPPVGDQQTTADIVTLVGQTDPFAGVVIVETGPANDGRWQWRFYDQ
ncbi:hypothetical protein L0222_06010 [bacterium]|nr:hypothetical protein [bacterium]